MALGEKADMARLSQKYPLCLLALCFLQDNMCLVSTEQTYVSIRHRVPATEVAWILSHWTATKAAFGVCSRALRMTLHQV